MCSQMPIPSDSEIQEYINSKLNELTTLGSASKQLSKKKRFVPLARRCHIAMAHIVVDVLHQHEIVLKERPELRDFFDAMLLLYQDCQNGHEQLYINEKL